MRICDRCGVTGTKLIDCISAHSNNTMGAKLWERTVSTGDLCPRCFEHLERIVREFMNSKVPNTMKGK